ncbi:MULTISPECIES: hypothetical protein [Aneurinibacillus]|uniref:Uncharacterized protein n=1 Tax=Aneurinibacillus thermoaerophilus TaxID=143495 RepID=A0A1G7XR27_ANETH|nr:MULTISPECIES: hypothetical protein [Aneurinibacillus]AMA73701.1 hypothetical protein ACH33_13090 [Aneurinibacillus sp. XH2]MED0677402.1 hypothetical protein [Aneurinibacillus thermoaerophilus]MED0679492.1 hypothetical protein [Aneurinibacillus thermoaerophilus]MED0737937.1 hypothetical protein [Aneurinibacillus thermoaerophilus]MED0756359.1 hypothetical protein [Aneurinibacillus thermoaerophilus]
MSEAWQRLKPDIPLPEERVSPGEETMGEVLNRLAFQDVYHMVEEDGKQYFPRLNARGDVEIVIVYDDIDAFGEQAEAKVYLDFTRYKQNWIAVLWVVTDPEEPLGYPLLFDAVDDTMRYMAVRFLEQNAVWVHYTAQADSGLIHLYSEAISFPVTEKEKATTLLLEAYHYDPGEEEDEGMPEKTAPGRELSFERLSEKGFSFYFDYRLMENRFGEEGAREQAMGAMYRALWMMRRHPNPQAREAEILLWVGEKVGKNRAGEETRLLVVTMTPQLLDVYQIVNLSELEANPLATMLMSLTEYQKLEEEYPLQQGYIPIAGYENGTLLHIEWDERSFKRLADAYAGEWPGHQTNPYQTIADA